MGVPPLLLIQPVNHFLQCHTRYVIFSSAKLQNVKELSLHLCNAFCIEQIYNQIFSIKTANVNI